MTKDDKLKLCVGCRNDFYNNKNPLGIKECWHLGSAMSAQKHLVGTWDRPPYEWNPQETLSCHQPQGLFVWLKADDSRFVEEAGGADVHGS